MSTLAYRKITFFQKYLKVPLPQCTVKNGIMKLVERESAKSYFLKWPGHLEGKGSVTKKEIFSLLKEKKKINISF